MGAVKLKFSSAFLKFSELKKGVTGAGGEYLSRFFVWPISNTQTNPIA